MDAAINVKLKLDGFVKNSVSLFVGMELESGMRLVMIRTQTLMTDAIAVVLKKALFVDLDLIINFCQNSLKTIKLTHIVNLFHDFKGTPSKYIAA